MPQDIYSTVEESLTRIEQGLLQEQKKGGRSSEIEHYTKQLKKVKNYMNNNRQSLTQQQKKAIQIQQNRIKVLFDKLKPMVIILKPEEKSEYRDKIQTCLKTIQKKVNALNEKKDNKKDNKKRQTNIQFFKYHQKKLSMFCQWLLSPSRKFSQQNMKFLVRYLNDLHISQDDSVFQDQLKEVYEKIICFAEEPLEITYDMFNASFANVPKINDYLPPKQTKENSYRSSICPTYKMIDLSVIPKMQKQLLFFIFYIHKAETEQYLAARELMRRGWRYYTRFHMWIKRCNHPNFDLNDQYETGNYYTMGTELIIRERRGIKINHRHLINNLGN